MYAELVFRPHRLCFVTSDSSRSHPRVCIRRFDFLLDRISIARSFAMSVDPVVCTRRPFETSTYGPGRRAADIISRHAGHAGLPAAANTVL